jgi:hypothetical protein
LGHVTVFNRYPLLAAGSSFGTLTLCPLPSRERESIFNACLRDQ